MNLAEFHESIRMALDALRVHKLRSALTLLGITVGVFSIIVVMTAIRAMQGGVESGLNQLGAHTFQIQRWPAIEVHSGPSDWEKYWRRRPLRYSQGLELRRQATLALHVGFQADFEYEAAISKYDQTNPDVALFGITPDIFAARNWVIDEGRAFLPNDIDSATKVCVLGDTLAKKLFPYGSPIGESVKFDGANYRVVGRLARKGGVFGNDQDGVFLVPITTALSRYGYRRDLTYSIQATTAATFEDTIEQVRGILRKLRKVPPGEPDDFEIVSNDILIRQFRQITLALRIGAAAISSVALLVAGIGIMNIMLVSVTERTREIGVRRAVGAKKRNILIQFLVEAVTLCQLGGAAGIILGILGGNSVAFFTSLTPVVPLDWVGLGVLICSAVGISFGTYPAYKAANIDPIDALRYE